MTYDARELGELGDHIRFEICWTRGLDPLCWVWTGDLQNKGYGCDRDRASLVHRLTYRILVGVIPDGMVLDHLCRRRTCCNPAHLEAVTNRVNCQRGAHAARGGSPACNSAEAREAFERALGSEAADAIGRILSEAAS